MWFMEEPSQFSVGQTAQFLTCSIIMERFRFSSIYIFANVWYSAVYAGDTKDIKAYTA